MARTARLSNEIVDRVARDAALSPYFVVLMAMSGVLAAVALLANSVPVLLGAMIVAPAFPPFALVAFALVGDRPRLALTGLVTALLGILTAVAFAMLTTWIVERAGIITEDADLLHRPLLEERLRPGWYSVIAAFAAGIAGTLATYRGKMDALIGTVASVALVPAGGAAAIALMEQDHLRALGGAVLLAINAGVIVAIAILVLLLLEIAQPR
ncbi:MAG TPA: DUF389 domain-containing protein [Candidatus Nanopelagicales bacterium]|nr:DUF389 domain-containing protein [Candidatus Nanopelagicales bacterium]